MARGWRAVRISAQSMNFLPVAERELRGASRRRGTYRTRTWAVLLAIIVCGGTLLDLAARGAPAPTQGSSLFLTMSITVFIYCLFIGAWITADCLSEEKREGTLGLLFLTDLKGYDVVWGKLAATSLNAFYGLVAIFPMLVLPLQMGGVAGQTVWRVLVIFLNTFFFSLALGLYISTTSQDERKAMVATIGTVFLLTVVPGILAVVAEAQLGSQWERTTREAFIISLLSLSAGYAFGATLMGVYAPAMPPPGWSVWVSLLVYHLAGWWCLWRACRLLPHVWQCDAKRGWMDRCQDALEQWSYGRAEKRRRHRTALLDRNPFLWHASRDRWKPRYVWLLLVSLTATWWWSNYGNPEWYFNSASLVPALMILNGFLKIWVASEACTRLVADRRAGALELLLSTPLTTGEIIHGQWLALRRQFGPPILAAFVVEYYALRHSFDAGVVLAGLAMTLLDILAAGWVGLWLGLKAKNTSHALALATGLVLILPWAGFLVVMLFFELVGTSAVSFLVAFRVWLTLGVMTDLGFGFLWARRRIRRDFRTVALR